jgi:hypothetical protein
LAAIYDTTSGYYHFICFFLTFSNTLFTNLDFYLSGHKRTGHVEEKLWAEELPTYVTAECKYG